MSEEQKFTGIDPCFNSVVEKHGLEMFSFVFNANMAGQAAGMLSAFAERAARSQNVMLKQTAPQLNHAVRTLAQAFNETAGALALAKGWTPEALAECQQGIELAWASKLAVAETPKIVLH